jgi:ribokinase
MEKVLVLGSINIDFVSFISKYPRPGETLVCKDFEIFQGGKGANQAIALSKLGIPTLMLGKIGDDPLKGFTLSLLKDSGVDISRISVSKEKSTGSASIWVNDQGQNSIIIYPGANGEVDRSYIVDNKKCFCDSSFLVTQFEVPAESVFFALKTAKEYGLKTIVDPAPVRDIKNDSFWKLIDYLLPNEIEIKELTKCNNILDGILALKCKGAKEVIVKLGKHGACYETKGKIALVPSILPEKTVVDTTGAGDCFVAGFLYGLIQEYDIKKAIRFANLVASYSIKKKGAAISFPKKSEIIWNKSNKGEYKL